MRSSIYLSMIVHNELMKVLDPPPALPPSKPRA
jgi:hypothetical protein